MEQVYKIHNVNIISREWNDDLVGYCCTLNTGKCFQVQFEKETNRLHADYNEYFPVLDVTNVYGLDLTEDEENDVKSLISRDEEFITKANELSEDWKISL